MNRDETFRCGKRNEDGRADIQFPGLDSWKARANGDLCCSYCGSFHPEQFLTFCKHVVDCLDVRVHIDFVPAKRKFYINRPQVGNAMEGAVKMYGVHIDEYLNELTTVEQTSIIEFINKAITISNTKIAESWKKVKSVN